MTKKTLSIKDDEVKYLIEHDSRLSSIIFEIGPISFETQRNPYGFLVHEIIEQMLSKKIGTILYNRLKSKCNNRICVKNISKLSIEEIQSIGISHSKAMSISCLTERIADKTLNLKNLQNLSDEKVIFELTKIHGIGTWTAKMFLIFVLNRQDVLPYEDGAFLQSYKWLYNTKRMQKKDIIKRCKKWKPYSSIAARYMYYALDMGLTKYNILSFRGNDHE